MSGFCNGKTLHARMRRTTETAKSRRAASTMNQKTNYAIVSSYVAQTGISSEFAAWTGQ